MSLKTANTLNCILAVFEKDTSPHEEGKEYPYFLKNGPKIKIACFFMV